MNHAKKAWNEIKAKLAEAPIMGYPDHSKPLYLHTDACKSGFAGILTQINYNPDIRTSHHVIINAASRTTTKTEKNYTSSKLDCACVIWIVKKKKKMEVSSVLSTIHNYHH